MLNRFNATLKKIYEEIEVYFDKPNPPGGFSNNHSDSGSITGNTCNFSTDPGNIGGFTSSDTKTASTDAGSVTEEDAAITPGMTTSNVLGPTGISIADTIGGGDNTPKVIGDPGVTTKDVKQIYSPALNTPGLKSKKKVKYPLFSRFKK